MHQHDEFATPAEALAAPKDRGFASTAALATAFRAATAGSWWTVARWVMENLPAIIRLLDEVFGQREALERDLGGKKPE